jgi:MFS family permease
MATTLTHTSARGAGMTDEEKFVIFASSLGTVFEWYDFYLYAVLAPFFAALFFPPGNDTAALLSAFATYAAGFLIRPFGALVFGRIGDLVGRKYTFLVTIMVMGTSTFLVGLLPTYTTIGWLAPILLVTLRLCQSLALGGEYGGAATYVAEHSRPGERGFRRAGSKPRRRSVSCSPSSSSPCAANTCCPRIFPIGAGAFRSSYRSSC